MIKFTTHFVILVTLVVLLSSFTVALAQYSVGDTVTNFTLLDVDSNSHSLYDYQGEVILLNFFATW